MSRVYLLQIICAILMLPVLSSCEQEALPLQTAFEEKTGTEYLNSYFTPSIMFHYAFTDENNNLYSGWFIDNKGKVRTYKMDYQPFSPTAFEIHKNDMKKLMDESEVLDVEIDIEILVEHYKKTIVVATKNLETLAENPDSETTSGFYAYTLSYGGDPEGCGGRRHSSLFQQVTLQYNGKTTVQNKSHLTVAMIQWMEQIQTNQGL